MAGEEATNGSSTAATAAYHSPGDSGRPAAPALGLGLGLVPPPVGSSAAVPLGVLQPPTPGGWTMLASPGLHKSNPSPKRAYGQVQRIAEDQWRCPDGKTFPRAYLAYRHLKELKEKNPNLLSPFKSPRTSTAERRAMHQRAVGNTPSASPGGGMDMDGTYFCPMSGGAGEPRRCVVELYGSRCNADNLTANMSMYEACRMWRSNDPFARKKTPSVENDNGIELPPPLPHTEESQATDYRENPEKPAQDLDSILASTANTPPELLLNMHTTYAKGIRNWWQMRRVHRINRFKKVRLDLILPECKDEEV